MLSKGRQNKTGYTAATVCRQRYFSRTTSMQLHLLTIHQARFTVFAFRNFLSHHALPAIFVRLSHLLFQMDNRLGWIQALRATIRAIHDAVTAIELHGVVYPSQSFLSKLVTGVCNPTVRLHEHC